MSELEPVAIVTNRSENSELGELVNVAVEIKQIGRLTRLVPGQKLYTRAEPISVDLSELREYHAKAISNLKSYADDAGLRESDVKHYTKRAEFHARMVELIDKASINQ